MITDALSDSNNGQIGTYKKIAFGFGATGMSLCGLLLGFVMGGFVGLAIAAAILVAAAVVGAIVYRRYQQSKELSVGKSATTDHVFAKGTSFEKGAANQPYVNAFPQSKAGNGLPSAVQQPTSPVSERIANRA